MLKEILALIFNQELTIQKLQAELDAARAMIAKLTEKKPNTM